MVNKRCLYVFENTRGEIILGGGGCQFKQVEDLEDNVVEV